MTSLSSQNVRQSLERKGFSPSDTDHKKLVLYIDGAKTSISTKVSHGPKHDIDDGLISFMKKQLRLETKDQFMDLIKCPLSANGYLEILRRNNHLEE